MATMHTSSCTPATEEPQTGTRLGQVFLKNVQIEGFKTFRDSENIDLCPGWKPLPASSMGSPAPSPLTIVFGGNGAGKSSVFEAVFFVLGQSSKSIRSSGGSSQLVNDQRVLKNGASAFASVIITFQKGEENDNMDVDSGEDLCVECTSSSNTGRSVRELLVGRSVKHSRGTSTYSVQGNTCSRAAMMQTLNDFVGADMGEVDRYVLKQGSTMVCRRDGKELLEFIERLAGTAGLKTETEEAQTALDDLRQEALGLEDDIQASRHARNKLQPQVDAFFAYQKDATGLRREKTGLWQRRLALLRLRLEGLESTAAKNEAEDATLRGTIKAIKAQHDQAERDLVRATRASEKALKSQSASRGRVQEAKSAQAEAEALARKNVKSARSKGKALTRALELVDEGEAEIAKLSAQASKLDSTSARTNASVVELERASELSFPGGDGEGCHRRGELLRELGALEGGPLPELEKSVAERKNLLAEARRLSDKLVSDLAAARRDVELTDGAVAASQGELSRLRERMAEAGAESTKLRARCASQQALIGTLEAARRGARVVRPRTTTTGSQQQQQQQQPPPPSITAGTPRPGGPPQPQQQQGERVGALRSLVERLREDGVGAHGLLADLVLLRRRCDEAAVAAVLGSALRDTVVVETRADGARVVAEVRQAGIIPGRIRCDVLDEIKDEGRGATVAVSGSRRGGKGGEGPRRGLTALSECVATSDPRYLPAVEKRLRGWLLAETRQAAWAAGIGSSGCSAPHVVTASGELFYAGGEVAVKAPNAFAASRAPRLAVQGGRRLGSGGYQQPPPPLAAAARKHAKENGGRDDEDVGVGVDVDVEVELKEAMKSLSVAETRMAELAREATEARFECEDEQVALATAKNKAKECRREMSRIEEKVSAQRRLIAASSGTGNNKRSEDEDADEAQLDKLRQRRDEIVAELAEDGSDEGEGAASEPGSEGTKRGAARRSELLNRRNQAVLELRSVKAKAEADRVLRDEVGVKLRFLTKRGKARRDRVEALKAEKRDLEAQLKSAKAGQLLHDQKIAHLLADLEETKSAYRAKREAARAAEGAARKARRELGASMAVRTELSKRQDVLNAERRKARRDSAKVVQFLLYAAEAEAASSRHGDGDDGEDKERLERQEAPGEDADGSASTAAATAAAATRLARSLDNYHRAQSSDTGGSDNGCKVAPGPRPTGGDGVRDRPRGGGGAHGRDGHEDEGRGDEDDFEVAAPPKKRDAPAPAVIPACREEDEAKVVAFARQLEAAGGGKAELLKEIGIAEASVRMKEASVKKRHEAFDAAAVARASRLDRESVRLERELDAARESVVLMMDKKEVLEATRHATVLKCLEEVNDALKGIYRRLTSVEDQGHTTGGSNTTTANLQACGKFGVRGVPGGDCFLRFSRERTLLFSEGLAVQVKPEASSPWRGPGALSGGQVALVGLALNLATQAVRPAPLYLMDEIDSALDTHKVRRVAMLLADRAKSGNEQCIVISHRPEMHARGSHLVGVYHCEGTARTVGLELISQLPPPPAEDDQDDEDEGEDDRGQRRPP
eukprot:g14628.t2